MEDPLTETDLMECVTTIAGSPSFDRCSQHKKIWSAGRRVKDNMRETESPAAPWVTHPIVGD